MLPNTLSQVHDGAPFVAAHYGPGRDPRASSGAGCEGMLTGRLDEQHSVHTPAAAERTGGMGQRQAPPLGAWCAAHAATDRTKNPGVFVPCSPWALVSRFTEALRVAMGEGGGIPTAMRHTSATGKP